jgi:hypothetical protein
MELETECFTQSGQIEKHKTVKPKAPNRKRSHLSLVDDFSGGINHPDHPKSSCCKCATERGSVNGLITKAEDTLRHSYLNR